MSRDDEDDCCTGLHLHDARVTAQLRSSKVQSSLTGSRQCAFHRAIDIPCALPLSPPKGGFKREFLHLALPFISSLQAIVDISNLICGLNIASPSLQMTNRP